MEKYKFDDLIQIMKKLRKECPWDKEQTHKSIRRNFLEEVYEACEAIDLEDIDLLKEELGDVLLQVIFHAEIESELNHFDMDDVCDGICKKLIYRHPHIFSDVSATTSDAVLHNWYELKKIEKNQQTAKEIVSSVAKSLPALMRTEKMLKKAHKENIETLDTSGIEVLAQQVTLGNEDISNLVFECVKLAIKNNVDLENNLHILCENYINNI